VVPAGYDRLTAMLLVRGISTLLLASCSAVLAGCESGAPPALDRTDLVSDLTTRIEHAGSLNYLAEYQISGGAVASLAQRAQPRQLAYRYPGGSLIMTPEATVTCAGTPVTCDQIATPNPGLDPPALGLLTTHGLVPADFVSSLLTTAALDLSSDYRQYENTIAGRSATCVEVSRVRTPVTSAFETCVLTDGVVGSFTGRINGGLVEFALARYRRELPIDAFATTPPSPDPR
jgi:hypothetical protein